MTKKIALVLGFLGLGLSVSAQKKQYADKIVATVGSKVVLLSDIGKQFMGEKQDKTSDLPEYAKCGMLRDAVAAKIMVLQADRDSVMVTSDEVETALDNQLNSVMYQGYGGDKAAMEKALGKTIYQVKEEYRPVIKDKLITQKMYQEVIKDVAITPKEVEAFFNNIPADQKSNIPATAEVGEIVLKPSVDPEIEAYTKQKVEDIRKQIVDDGQSFSTMAQIYSEDAGANNGGELNLNRKGNYDSRFIAAAFKLQPGEISPVFRSSFGYHIIQMLERNGDDAKIRYIVVIPQSTTGDYDKALAQLDSVRNLLVSSKLSFSEAVNKVSNDESSKQMGGMIRDQNSGSSILSIDAVDDPQVALQLSELDAGEYSKPMIFKDPTDQNRKVRILYIKSKTPPHQINLKDDYSMIQNYALQTKKMNYINEWLKEKKNGYYIKIDPDFLNSCSELQMFVNKN